MEAPLRPTEPGSSHRRGIGLDSIPEDLVIAIASYLGPRDLLSLGSCSHFWYHLCASDYLWASLSACRWPLLVPPCLPSLEWKEFYIRRHQEMASRVSNVVTFVKNCSQNESLEGSDFLKAVADLQSMGAGFLDIKFFLLTVKHSVLLNLIGLHYLIFSLRVPGIDVTEALRSSCIAERRVCVNWFTLGRWFYVFRHPDESRSRRVSLWELATSEEEVRSVLNRGVIHEVLRVQITKVVGDPS
ncbi:unnamed protein product [Spirodela intermedia]|uniref:F-box domain-containing protein n=1 Tax=Spirodela intermedia TaxID=51605 RepID=A0A7I8KRL4_SPIIN|nr:unnamed protein product [Spirodela intermedia]